MDKSWMRLRHRYYPEYIKGIDDFIEFAMDAKDSMDRIRCPCNKCKNSKFMHINDVKDHLYDNGMDKNYTHWGHHGEPYEVLDDDDDHMRYLLRGLNMDKSWMRLRHRYYPEYIKGIDDFIEFAMDAKDSMDRIRCSCNKCKNSKFMHINDVKDHLYDNGMDKNYTHWGHHGEPYEVLDDDDDDDTDTGPNGEDFLSSSGWKDLLEDLQRPSNFDNSISDSLPNESNDGSGPSNPPNLNEEGSESFDSLLIEARKPLFPGCGTSTLDFIMKLLHLKIVSRMANKYFSMLLELIKNTFPVGESFPKSHYEAKTLMRKLGLGYIPIHACVNDCVLFWKQNEKLENCPVCKQSRYQVQEGRGKKIPQKILRYFPLKPRLQRLFMSRMTAEDMRWHKEKRVEEEKVLRHPADSEVWKKFDEDHEWFGGESRNVRLGLASDGFNPFGNMNNNHSMWPVMVVPYNLPPWKCMKEPFIFMSLLIPGPKAPGNDIDVYLQPLVDELKDLWQTGVITYDAFSKKEFRMYAALLWTINDFPAYANLSGWSTKGKMACPVCNGDTSSMYLKHGRKLCYMNHFRFLPVGHRLRNRCRQLFRDQNACTQSGPEHLFGEDLLSQLGGVESITFGKTKKRKRMEKELNWTKKSIFFELPYWSNIVLRHNLDVMHIEKNIFESVLGTLLDMEGKSKDSIKARMDLEALGVREELHLIPNGNNFTIPAACYTLSSAESKAFCEWAKSVKFPDGFASNVSRCVNAKDGKISGLKSHDCHVFIQRLLPVAVRGFLASDVASILIELGVFFRELCCRTLRLEVLEKMENDIAVVLCKLEQVFPPAFFDIMVHLAVHLPREAILGGPVQYRWMYPIERFLHTLKQYVRNKARPEGSIAEAYIDSECLTFCSMYLQGIETRFNREDRNFDGGDEGNNISLDVFKPCVRPLGASKYFTMDIKDKEKAHFYVLNNSEDIATYIEEHKLELTKQSSLRVEERHEKLFPKWFEKRIQKLRDLKSLEVTDELYSLARGPDLRAYRYSGCIVNGIRFHTRDRELRLRTQNSGVVVKGVHQSKEMDFYGVLIDIIELQYLYKHRVFLFKCDWWDVRNRAGIRSDTHFTSVNTSRKWYVDDQFVLCSQAEQVFYIKDTKLGGDWQVVQKITPRNVYDVPEIEADVESEHPNEVYQQEEQVILNEANDDLELEFLNRENIIQREVDADVVRTIERNVMGEISINDDEILEEDDTLMDYIDEEDNVSSDDDTDID